MIILIVLILLVVGGWFLASYTVEQDTSLPFVLSAMAEGILVFYLLLHTICMSTAWMEYEGLATERSVLEQTMHNSRTLSEGWENAGLTIKVIEFNEKLAKYKRQNTYILMDDWIDDRVNLMPYLR